MTWSFHRISIKAKLITSYLVILGAGGLATSLVGSWIVSSTLLTQVRRTVDAEFTTAQTIYQQKLDAIRLPVEYAARSLPPPEQLAGFDFLAHPGPDDPMPRLAAESLRSRKVLAAAEILPDRGLVLLAAAPTRDGKVLCGGVSLDGGRPAIGEKLTIVRGAGRTSAEIADTVLRLGHTWIGREQGLISEYGPIRDYRGNPIGMLAVGLPENIYTDTRNQVILSFFAIATTGFIVIMAMTYYMIRNITQPLSAMVEATKNITAGRFDQEVHTNSPGEIAALADSFNAMQKSLRAMRADLEEWGSTLEQKVHERTEQLAAMQARVAQSERLASLGMLGAGVAHEINNPLGGILALTSLTLEDMAADDPNRECLEEVIRQTERCRDIVLRLLEFSRQSKARMELVDINDILDKTLALIGKQSMFFNVTIEKDYGPGVPSIAADRSQIQQVFMNLLMNAAQAMDERGTLTIATRFDGAADKVEIAISDTGCGIPPEQIDRIFDPFFTTKASGQGTGLGLSITYGIVTTHGGTIAVDSRPGAGSTFTIRLPAAMEVAAT
jgi:signal transduction histidine kinase